MLTPFVEPEALEQVEGSVDVTLDFTAGSRDLATVSGEIILERFSLAVADLPVRQTVPTRVVVEDGVARVAAWDWQGEGASLSVSGEVGLVDRVAALETDGSLDLRLLAPFVRGAGITPAGRLEPRLSLAGSLDEPSITGTVQLADGAFRLAEPAVIIDDLEAAAEFAGGAASLTTLRGTINGGSLAGSGSLQYAPETRGTFTFDVAGMALNAPQGLRSEIDAALELGLAPEPGSGALGGELSGVVTVTRSSYREPLALVTGLLGNLRSASGGEAAADASPALDRLALDVRVVTDDDLVIRNNVARAEVGADLRVIGTAARPSLSGRAELREGGQLFLGRNIYTVDTGAIDFANPVAIEPDLDIVASTRAGGEEIEIALSGTPDALTRSLSSPSAPELGEADLTALLLTGRRMDQLGSAQAAEVSAQLLGDLSGDVLGVAGRAVGLDTLRVGGVDTSTTLRRDPADLASEVDPTTRLTFGKTLGSDLDVTWSQSLRDADAQTWIIDYAPVRQIDLRLISDDDDLRTYAFRHDVTFGAPPRARSDGAAPARMRLRVSAVRLTGSPGFPEAELRRQIRLEPGDRFDFIDWQEDRDRIARFYRERGRLAARIDADRIESAGGVDLVYALDAGPETRVRVRGVEVGGEVVAAIEDAWAESIFDGFLIDEAQEIVRTALARDGYLRPDVAVEMTDVGGARTLDVAVEPGERTRQTEVRVEGVDEPLRSDVAEAARTLVDDARGVMAPEEAAAGVVGFLRMRGYADAAATVGAPEFEGATVTLPVVVSPGIAFAVGTIAFDGVSALEVDVLREDVGLATGETHDPAAVESARRAVQGRYRLEGFTTAVVSVRQQPRPEAEAIDVVFEVAEGPRQTVGEIAVSGRRAIDEDVVLRTMDLAVGEPLRAADWLEARQRLFESGLFRRADISLEPLPEESRPEDVPREDVPREDVPPEAASGNDTGPATTPMRVRVVLEEWPALRLRYGFQVAEQRPEEDVNGRDLTPGLSADLTRRTLFGRAITVGGAGQWERREWLGRLFLNTPTLFRLPVQSSLSLERSRNVFAETRVRDGSAISWEQRARRGALRLSYGLRFERNHTYLRDAPIDPDFPVVDETIRIGLLTGSGAWDTRNDPADASRGTLLSSTIEHASGRLGSDLLFVRSLTQAYHFRTWKDVVFASAGRLGLVQPLSGQVLDPAERFFAGGSRTVRGVSEDGLGERDFFGPLGGRALVVVNQEARVPLFWWFRGVAFVDAGNVFDRIGDFDLSNLTGSVGLGVRVATPFVLLRADYGRTVWGSTEEAAGGRWTFGIGHTF
jgi:outer membrane protein assembly factor BamA